MNETNCNSIVGIDAVRSLSVWLRKWMPTCLWLVAISMAPSAKAELFCVQDASELTGALSVALIVGGANEIRLQTGTYQMPDGYFNGGTSPYTSSLTISGGWNNDCSAQDIDPISTTISGQGNTNSTWRLVANASVTVRSLSFSQMGGLHLESVSCQPSGQHFRVSNVRVRNSVNGTSSFASLFFASGCHAMRVENSLITGGALDGIEFWCRGSSTYRLVNNTVLDVGGNAFATALSPNACGGNAVGADWLVNNVLGDVQLSGTTPRAHHNIYSTLNTSNGGGFYAGSSDNLTVDPQLDPINYRPIEPGSPTINSGTDNVPGGLPATDIEGNPRDIGGIPDRGAYESSVVPPGPFVLTVTSNADSGAGTLREAISQGNASSGLNLITFDMGGDCPRLITLATPLPDITESVIINGFSQPGASFNSLDNGNNSVLCVGVRASIFEDVPWALRVPPDSGAVLKVQGLGFGGFADGGGLLGEAAIFLQGGSGHEIQGNQFSGAFHATTLAPNAEGVRLMNNATDALIGGSSPSLRNTFSKSNVAAILILGSVSSDHEIVNNYIGTTPSGLAAAGNYDGIRIIQSGGNHVLDNLISGNVRDGVLISGEQATGNVVGNNRIGGFRPGFLFCGPSPLPPCPPPLTNRKGIFIDNDANNNTIGQATFVGGPNRIRYSTQHGIRVLSGQRNRVLNNSLLDNGTGANELDIDIDAFGLGGIDSDCGPVADGKANRGQNRPLIDTAEGNGNTLSVTGTLSSCTHTGGFTGIYRLQFFASNDCAANGHGPAQYFLGNHNISLAGPDQNDVIESFAAELEHPWLSMAGKYITATATDIFGNTSELSQCVQAEVSDILFSDRFEQ